MLPMSGMGLANMQMGVPMAVPMGMSVAMPMGMGMPMMGMMGMGMPMMTPMMTSTLAAQQQQQQQQMLQQLQRQQLQLMQQQEELKPEAALQSLLRGWEASSMPAASGGPPAAFAADEASERERGRLSRAAAAAEISALAGQLLPKEMPLDLKQGDPSQGVETSSPSSSSTAAVAAGAPKDDKKAAEEAPPPACHLHSLKKPNGKCKFCQRFQAFQEKQAAQSRRSPVKDGRSPPAKRTQAEEEGKGEDYSRRTFNCSPMLKDQIMSSIYFKSLLNISSMDDLVEEMAKFADTLAVYNVGSSTSPSCFIAQVYRLFTMPQAEDMGEIQAIVDYQGSPVVRCAGLLYMRFVVPPSHLWEKLEEYLFDDTELKYSDGGKQTWNTIGDYVEAILVKDKYFGTPLPRIPVKVRQMLEKELAPLQQYRKRMEANLRTFPAGRRMNVPVEVCVDGEWVSGSAREYIGRTQLRRRIRVRLDTGQTVAAHLGKVVLRETDDKHAEGSGAESGNEGGSGKRKRSRSGHRRGGEVDWSRYKGRDGAELVNELRERAKEDAVCGVGQVYSRRPLTVEEELWKREPESRVSMLGEERHGGGAHRRVPHERDEGESEVAKKLRREDEEARMKLQRSILEKYGSMAPAGSSSKAASSATDVEGPDVLRLG